jgi:phosphoesterase RecJ-like protein
VRELIAKEGQRKVSLRATDGRIDVSIIARKLGGGGHRQAAGFTTDLPFDQLVERLRTELAAQL